MTYVLACSKIWRPQMAANIERRTGKRTVLITEKTDLSHERLLALDPEYVFLPHWSHTVPAEVYEHFRCIVFHMTDVPFGRGGSPLQNLIARGIYETKISAIRCTREIDAGPVYMKASLSLQGSAQEIYTIASAIIEEMIVAIAVQNMQPVEQSGDVVVFRRRRREDGDISHVERIEQVHDYIRMLDADGYPPAFLETNRLVLEFTRSSLRDGVVHADVRIRIKGGDEN